MLARFHRSRVCGNRPRTALAISKNDEYHTHTYTQTDRLTLCAPRYEEALRQKTATVASLPRPGLITFETLPIDRQEGGEVGLVT